MTTVHDLAAMPPRERGLFSNRTLNMRAIRAVGYDMDYTLVHYRPEVWEERAYAHLKRRLAADGFPVDALEFDPDEVIRGLIIDAELGNIVKANRFGFVKQARHGTRALDFETQRKTYARTLVDLGEPRWSFLNTFFSLSEAWLYAQLVDLLDDGRLPVAIGYADLYERVRRNLDAAHTEGELKGDIMKRPDDYVVLDEECPLALLDQKRAGKRLLLITNSEWSYTAAIMSYAFDRFLPGSMTWRELFDLVIVDARKPSFFSARGRAFEVVSPDGLLRPAVGPLQMGRVYLGGDASMVEQALGASGDEILYVGDHIYGDVHVSKNLLRWRTGLIVRELEDEIRETEAHLDEAARLGALMRQKTHLEHFQCRLRLEIARQRQLVDPTEKPPPPVLSPERVQHELTRVREELSQLDVEIAPLARAAGATYNARWGPIMRAGNDKSHFTRQVERSADIYTSRVSNFLLHTPYAYLRSPRGTIPHDPEPLVIAEPTATAGADVDQ